MLKFYGGDGAAKAPNPSFFLVGGLLFDLEVYWVKGLGLGPGLDNSSFSNTSCVLGSGISFKLS